MIYEQLDIHGLLSAGKRRAIQPHHFSGSGPAAAALGKGGKQHSTDGDNTLGNESKKFVGGFFFVVAHLMG